MPVSVPNGLVLPGWVFGKSNTGTGGAREPMKTEPEPPELEAFQILFRAPKGANPSEACRGVVCFGARLLPCGPEVMLLLDGVVLVILTVEQFYGTNADPNDGVGKLKTEGILFELLPEANPPEENSCFGSAPVEAK